MDKVEFGYVSAFKGPSSGRALIRNSIKPSISYVLNLIELLINERPEHGLIEAETCSHP
jgi:hypothetical protein